MPKVLTQLEFINRCVEIHGNRYNYSDSIYKNVRTKILIECTLHGKFYQKAELHLLGHGCHKCAGTIKLTNDEFVSRSINKHKNKYDYSKTKYKNDTQKVLIVCPNHGSFSQRPADHMNGRGCPKCGRTGKSNIDEFVSKANKVHLNKFCYKKSIYVNDSSKLLIECEKHGCFSQTPNDHLSGVGCPKCGGTKKLTTEEFVKKSIEVHGDRYDYSKSKYLNAHSKIEIVCLDHGEFSQKAYSHLSGHGCPKCKESKGERAIRKVLDFYKFLYSYQHRFDGCRRKSSLPFDFVVWKNSKIIAIEYHGEQHYRPVSFGGNAEENFKNTTETDSIKKIWCEENNVELLIISYEDYDNISGIIPRWLV